MKKIKIVAVFLSMMAGAYANADYQCTSYDQKETLKVNENYITHLGDTHVLLESDADPVNLFGTVVLNEGGLLKKKVIEFYGTDDTLTIVNQPKSCGRGSCDYDQSPIITASLKIDGNSSYFSCDEVNL